MHVLLIVFLIIFILAYIFSLMIFEKEISIIRVLVASVVLWVLFLCFMAYISSQAIRGPT